MKKNENFLLILCPLAGRGGKALADMSAKNKKLFDDCPKQGLVELVKRTKPTGSSLAKQNKRVLGNYY